MLLLNADDIWQVYTMGDAIRDIEAALVATVEGAALTPLRTQIPAEERTFLMMPSYSAGIEAAAVKTIAICPGNADRGLPTAPATIVLLDGDTGMPRALLDGATVTQMRTGASSGAAFRHLGRPDARTGLIVGTGSQALTQVLALLEAAPDLTELRVANPYEGEADAFLDRLRAHPAFQALHFGGQLRAFCDADAAATDADLITLVTSSTSPVLSAQALSPGATVSCVGSYRPDMQECGSDIMAAADLIVCDDVEAALEESGDLLTPLKEGVISRDDLGCALGDVIAGRHPGRTSPDDLIVYETVGVGAMDLWAAHAIVAAAQGAGVGTTWQ